MTEFSYNLPEILVHAVRHNKKLDKMYGVNLDISEETMSKLQSVVGDGNAKVTVGMDLSKKHYGEGFSVFLSCGLTCDQSNVGMRKAARYCIEFLQENASQLKEAVQEIYQNEFGDEE